MFRELCAGRHRQRRDQTSQIHDLALSLISGGWNVAAAQNIILQEVRNPNGVFEQRGAAFNHYFNYAPNDYVNLSAGNLVQLGASVSSAAACHRPSTMCPFIYPSILNITAGAGGIYPGHTGFSQQPDPFPFAAGQPHHRHAGFARRQPRPAAGSPQLFNLIVSDSGSRQFNTTSPILA